MVRHDEGPIDVRQPVVHRCKDLVVERLQLRLHNGKEAASDPILIGPPHHRTR